LIDSSYEDMVDELKKEIRTLKKGAWFLRMEII
jgi:hypothetical protein